MPDHEIAPRDGAAEGIRKMNFVEELEAQVRSNHRLRWELARSPSDSNPSLRSQSEDYVEMTEYDVTRAVSGILAAMEQQMVDAYYDALEAQDYEDYLASELEDKTDEVLSAGLG